MYLILIYIPLCIYLNRGRQLVKLRRIVIYIPLCIYLNGATWVMNQATTIFTFHYVSI